MCRPQSLMWSRMNVLICIRNSFGNVPLCNIYCWSTCSQMYSYDVVSEDVMKLSSLNNGNKNSMSNINNKLLSEMFFVTILLIWLSFSSSKRLRCLYRLILFNCINAFSCISSHSEFLRLMLECKILLKLVVVMKGVVVVLLVLLIWFCVVLKYPVRELR